MKSETAFFLGSNLTKPQSEACQRIPLEKISGIKKKIAPNGRPSDEICPPEVFRDALNGEMNEALNGAMNDPLNGAMNDTWVGRLIVHRVSYVPFLVRSILESGCLHRHTQCLLLGREETFIRLFRGVGVPEGFTGW